MTAVSARDAGHHEIEVGETAQHAVGRKFISGSVAGIVMTCLTHSLDTVKTRLQCDAQGEYGGSMIRCASSTLKKEGAMALYRGAAAPITIAGAFNAALFACNEAAKKFLHRTFGVDSHALWVIALAAIMSAPPTIALITPADLVRIQLQVEHGARVSPIACVRRLVHEHGFFRGLFRGYSSALLKEFAGSPFYFMGFAGAKKCWKKTFPQHSDFVTSLVAGGAAGVSYWAVAAPFDTAKTCAQAQKAAHPLSATQVARNIFAKSGVKGFYVGFGACIVRAIPANASCFASISLCDDWLDGKGW